MKTYLVILIISALLTSCLPPPPRGAKPPTPPHPGAWVQPNRSNTPMNNFGNLQV